jgi:hypothetical protein
MDRVLHGPREKKSARLRRFQKRSGEERAEWGIPEPSHTASHVGKLFSRPEDGALRLTGAAR